MHLEGKNGWGKTSKEREIERNHRKKDGKPRSVGGKRPKPQFYLGKPLHLVRGRSLKKVDTEDAVPLRHASGSCYGCDCLKERGAQAAPCAGGGGDCRVRFEVKGGN